MPFMDNIMDALKGYDVTIISEKNQSVVLEIARSERLMKLADVKNGDSFAIAGCKFIKLGDDMENGIPAITEHFLCRDMFGETNDYKTSHVRQLINGDFRKKIEAAIGEINLLGHFVDLITEDGLKDYGTVYDKVSLMTTENYRKYHQYLGDAIDWWWTATPFSTFDHNDKSIVSFIGDYGSMDKCKSTYQRWVRPFCVFSPSLYVRRLEV